ncbi:hypothetical protein J5T34_19995 [Cupriavidus gilardii]|uniref:hypothetical protein n=1 Tax=Cupriavidus gilardii TaxID=82541 RepID=UPI001ABEB497|nr:hypothetical protein [Cupriavidus gilardii]MBO4123014.1 hypothetical protein [Cupriavidus gilardii]
MAKVRVFVDTNIILEAFRTGCWAAICERYAIETVEKCVEEALTGDLSRVVQGRRLRRTAHGIDAERC